LVTRGDARPVPSPPPSMRHRRDLGLHGGTEERDGGAPAAPSPP
jgi:hypothetical protein